jgi:hypothetical protein
MRYVILLVSIITSALLFYSSVFNAWLSGTPVADPSIYSRKAGLLFVTAFATLVAGLIGFAWLTVRSKRKLKSDLKVPASN